MEAVRDRQRSAVYAAEDLVARRLDQAAASSGLVRLHGSTITVEGDVRFGSLDAVADYCHRLPQQRWFTARWPAAAAVPLTVRARRGHRLAVYEPPGTVAVHEPRYGTGWALRELVVLHEIAHHILHHQADPTRLAAHGPEFTGTMQQLVADQLGPPVGWLLASAFHDAQVTVGPSI